MSRTKTEQRYETMLMSLPGSERVAMAGDMFASARDLVVAGMPPDQATTPRLVRRYLFLAFYGNDFDPGKRDKILAHLDAVTDQR